MIPSPPVFLPICDRIYTLAAMEAGTIEKERKAGQGERREGRMKKRERGGERKKKGEAVSWSHIYSDVWSLSLPI